MGGIEILLQRYFNSILTGHYFCSKYLLGVFLLRIAPVSRSFLHTLEEIGTCFF